MDNKNIPIDPQVHRQAKIAAVRRGTSLKGFTERALLMYLDLLDSPRTLVDTKAPYEVQEETPCSP